MINDDEIDLTEHRDFRDSPQIVTFRRINGRTYSNITTFIEQTVNRQMYGKFPWAVTPLYRQKEYKYDGLIALGNKDQRKNAIECASWGTSDNITCDCCGRKYIKIPWEKDWGICKDCSKEMDYSYSSFPWNE